MSDPAHLWTQPNLQPVLEELQQQEPIFHRPEYTATLEDFAVLMSADYWRVGASGRHYERAFILKLLADKPPVDSAAAGWRSSKFACREIGPETYLLTYTLDQAARISRRSTIWRRMGDSWQILFHQGTLVTDDKGDGEKMQGEPDTVKE